MARFRDVTVRGRHTVLRRPPFGAACTTETRAPVAQLDRAPDYEFGGQEFESLRARHFATIWNKTANFFGCRVQFERVYAQFRLGGDPAIPIYIIQVLRVGLRERHDADQLIRAAEQLQIFFRCACKFMQRRNPAIDLDVFSVRRGNGRRRDRGKRLGCEKALDKWSTIRVLESVHTAKWHLRALQSILQPRGYALSDRTSEAPNRSARSHVGREIMDTNGTLSPRVYRICGFNNLTLTVATAAVCC